MGSADKFCTKLTNIRQRSSSEDILVLKQDEQPIVVSINHPSITYLEEVENGKKDTVKTLLWIRTVNSKKKIDLVYEQKRWVDVININIRLQVIKKISAERGTAAWMLLITYLKAFLENIDFEELSYIYLLIKPNFRFLRLKKEEQERDQNRFIFLMLLNLVKNKSVFLKRCNKGFGIQSGDPNPLLNSRRKQLTALKILRRGKLERIWTSINHSFVNPANYYRLMNEFLGFKQVSEQAPKKQKQPRCDLEVINPSNPQMVKKANLPAPISFTTFIDKLENDRGAAIKMLDSIYPTNPSFVEVPKEYGSLSKMNNQIGTIVVKVDRSYMLVSLLLDLASYLRDVTLGREFYLGTSYIQGFKVVASCYISRMSMGRGSGFSPTAVSISLKKLITVLGLKDRALLAFQRLILNNKMMGFEKSLVLRKIAPFISKRFVKQPSAIPV